jgi:MFS family permease
MYTLFSVYSSAYVGLDKFWIGVLFGLSGFMVALFQYYISTKVSRHRMTAALAFSAVVFALGFGMLSLSTAFFMPFMAMAVITFAEMIWAPASSTLQANMSPENMRGRYFGFNGLTGSIGWAIGPLFGGVLKDSMNNNVPLMWAVVGAMFLISMIGFLRLGQILSNRVNAARDSEKLEKIEIRVEG